MKYQAPTGSSDPNAGYVGRNLAAGQQGSRVPPAAVEHPQRELVNLIEKSGFTPTLDLAQVSHAVRSQKLNYRSSGGSRNAASITLDPPPSGYTELTGVPLRIMQVGFPNNGAMTLNVNGLGAVNVVRTDGQPLKAGDVPASSIFEVAYNGTSFQMLNRVQSEGIRDTIVQYTTPGTFSWTVPSNVTRVFVEVWGGGGGGGGGAGNTAGGGAGGAGYAEGFIDVTPGASVSVVVGAAGAGGGTGGNGGTSSFAGVITATGGTGGGDGTGVPGAGGTGSGGQFQANGGNGGTGYFFGGTRAVGGFGAPSFRGTIVQGQDAAGTQGYGPGGGGAGGAQGGLGGAGRPGQVIIRY